MATVKGTRIEMATPEQRDKLNLEVMINFAKQQGFSLRLSKNPAFGNGGLHSKDEFILKGKYPDKGYPRKTIDMAGGDVFLHHMLEKIVHSPAPVLNKEAERLVGLVIYSINDYTARRPATEQVKYQSQYILEEIIKQLKEKV